MAKVAPAPNYKKVEDTKKPLQKSPSSIATNFGTHLAPLTSNPTIAGRPQKKHEAKKMAKKK